MHSFGKEVDRLKVTVIVLDSVGAGALPDAAEFGDEGVDTLGHIAAVTDLRLPNLQQLGLGNLHPIRGVEPVPAPRAAFGKMAEKSRGKDTTTGHWEICGLILDKPFPTYPNGFPPDLIAAFERAIGRRVLGNKVASGTAIIEELGAEHMRTGYPIVYTSADSVFQVAAHEEVIPLDELYRICSIARELLTGPHAVARVIARPFVGRPGNFRRTYNRRDFSLAPPAPTLLDRLKEAGYAVVGIGKIEDIFAGRGLTRAVHTEGNMDGVDKTLNFMQEDMEGLIFTNLVDYDSLYGHRNDPEGYARALMDFDRRVPELLAALSPGDLLVITADHGCDPVSPGTDHTREYVPLLVYGSRVKAGYNLGIRETFADLGATVAEIFGVSLPVGRSFAGEILVS
ncbi:MAG: phosphopentomutase [Eubacteriales bacterium]|nr:phosphopentomutase [Eubacteriales bacterium]